MVNNRNKSGIYFIRNTINNKVYVGKTKDFHRRYKQYLYDIKNQRTDHVNTYLANAVSKYGLENFEFIVAEFCNIEQCSERELHWIEHMNSTDRKFGYNLRKDSSTGMLTHPETSAKISDNMKKSWARGDRKDHSKKISEKWKDESYRELQSSHIRKRRTKYCYIIDFVEYEYQDIVSFGLQSVISKFHKSKSNTVLLKGVTITRRLISES